MRAWVVPEHGGPEVLKLETRPIPEPGAGQIRMRAVRGALNHLDLWVRRGVPGVKYPLPMIPISDVAGVVDAVGPGADRFKVGKRIVLFRGGDAMSARNAWLPTIRCARTTAFGVNRSMAARRNM